MTDPASASATEGTSIARKYGDAAGYDTYMGYWSSALAPIFLGFAALQQPASLLDVGMRNGKSAGGCCGSLSQRSARRC